jgi:alkanesulfonate monooxygenase SsuD/methylene tetrahydromethanopterin reductase-like flavin-dependent oxidoreductase (luciferase family)
VKLALHLPDFTWPGGPPSLGRSLGELARAADDARFDRVSVMDHVFQIRGRGPADHGLLEA